MIEQKQDETGTEAEIESGREGGSWELLKQAKKPLPWPLGCLTQTHFLVFH